MSTLSLQKKQSKKIINGNASTMISILLFLVTVPSLSSLLPRNNSSAFIKRTLAQIAGRNSFWIKAGDGYYENLMQQSHDQSKDTFINLLTKEKKSLNAIPRGEIYSFGGFLQYQGKPNLNFKNTVEGPINTNSYGFFDHEYPRGKNPVIRRIVVLGDSVARGWGVETNQRFTNVLDEELNTKAQQKFEILNFAVSGYRLSQIYDLGMGETTLFNPDVYILALTDLTAGPTWADHIKQLVDKDANLKYDLLNEVVEESQVKKGDSPELSQWKLATYRKEVLRSMLLQMQEHAKQHSAGLIVVLVPAAQDQDFVDLHFIALREALSNTGITIIDLSDTFRSMDVNKVRLNWYDPHPNALGHELIADNLYNKLRENPEAWAAITGIPERPTELNGKLTAVENTPVTHNLMTKEAH